ncbi:hypothetical protein SCOR_19665 [Sulfidibacter corallicola]
MSRPYPDGMAVGPPAPCLDDPSPGPILKGWPAPCLAHNLFKMRALARHQQRPCKGHTLQRRVRRPRRRNPGCSGIPNPSPVGAAPRRPIGDGAPPRRDGSAKGHRRWRELREALRSPAPSGLDAGSPNIQGCVGIASLPFAVLCRPFRTPAGGVPSARVLNKLWSRHSVGHPFRIGPEQHPSKHGISHQHPDIPTPHCHKRNPYMG